MAWARPGGWLREFLQRSAAASSDGRSETGAQGSDSGAHLRRRRRFVRESQHRLPCENRRRRHQRSSRSKPRARMLDNAVPKGLAPDVLPLPSSPSLRSVCAGCPSELTPKPFPKAWLGFRWGLARGVMQTDARLPAGPELLSRAAQTRRPKFPGVRSRIGGPGTRNFCALDGIWSEIWCSARRRGQYLGATQRPMLARGVSADAGAECRPMLGEVGRCSVGIGQHGASSADVLCKLGEVWRDAGRSRPPRRCAD